MRGIADGASDAGAKWLGPPHRPDGYRGGQRHRGAGRIARAPCPSRPPAWKASPSTRPPTAEKKRDSVTRPLQRLRRHRPRHARRQDGHRPCHLVALTLAEADQRDARYQARQRPSRADAELSRRHRERHRLVSERRRRGPHRNHHPPDALQRRRARRWPSARAWPSSTAATSTRWSSVSAPATTASTPTSG